MVDKIDPIKSIFEVTKRVTREMETVKPPEKPQAPFAPELAAALARLNTRSETIRNDELLLAKYKENKAKILDIKEEISQKKRGNIDDKVFLNQNGIYPDYMGTKLDVLG